MTIARSFSVYIIVEILNLIESRQSSSPMLLCLHNSRDSKFNRDQFCRKGLKMNRISIWPLLAVYEDEFMLNN